MYNRCPNCRNLVSQNDMVCQSCGTENPNAVRVVGPLLLVLVAIFVGGLYLLYLGVFDNAYHHRMDTLTWFMLLGGEILLGGLINAVYTGKIEFGFSEY